MITSVFYANVHVYGKYPEYVDAHELLTRVYGYENDIRFWVFHHQNGCVNGVNQYDNAYAREQLIRVHVSVHALP